MSSSSTRTKVKFTGKKLGDKVYYKHTGYAGGIKEVTAQKVLEGRFPERVLEKAIERMIPRGPLGRQQMRNLRIFAGAEHPHEAQNPEVIDRRFPQPQEQGGCIMSDTVNSLSDLQGLTAGADTAAVEDTAAAPAPPSPRRCASRS
jgi:hypothetical protein